VRRRLCRYHDNADTVLRLFRWFLEGPHRQDCPSRFAALQRARLWGRCGGVHGLSARGNPRWDLFQTAQECLPWITYFTDQAVLQTSGCNPVALALAVNRRLRVERSG
jgi:hypothetical protein